MKQSLRKRLIATITALAVGLSIFSFNPFTSSASGILEDLDPGATVVLIDDGDTTPSPEIELTVGGGSTSTGAGVTSSGDATNGFKFDLDLGEVKVEDLEDDVFIQIEIKNTSSGDADFEHLRISVDSISDFNFDLSQTGGTNGFVLDSADPNNATVKLDFSGEAKLGDGETAVLIIRPKSDLADDEDYDLAITITDGTDGRFENVLIDVNLTTLEEEKGPKTPETYTFIAMSTEEPFANVGLTANTTTGSMATRMASITVANSVGTNNFFKIQSNADVTATTLRAGSTRNNFNTVRDLVALELGTTPTTSMEIATGGTNPTTERHIFFKTEFPATLDIYFHHLRSAAAENTIGVSYQSLDDNNNWTFNVNNYKYEQATANNFSGKVTFELDEAGYYAIGQGQRFSYAAIVVTEKEETSLTWNVTYSSGVSTNWDVEHSVTDLDATSAGAFVTSSGEGLFMLNHELVAWNSSGSAGDPAYDDDQDIALGAQIDLTEFAPDGGDITLYGVWAEEGGGPDPGEPINDKINVWDFGAVQEADTTKYHNYVPLGFWDEWQQQTNQTGTTWDYQATSPAWALNSEVDMGGGLTFKTPANAFRFVFDTSSGRANSAGWNNKTFVFDDGYVNSAGFRSNNNVNTSVISVSLEAGDKLQIYTGQWGHDSQYTTPGRMVVTGPNDFVTSSGDFLATTTNDGQTGEGYLFEIIAEEAGTYEAKFDPSTTLTQFRPFISRVNRVPAAIAPNYSFEIFQEEKHMNDGEFDFGLRNFDNAEDRLGVKFDIVPSPRSDFNTEFTIVAISDNDDPADNVFFVTSSGATSSGSSSGLTLSSGDIVDGAASFILWPNTTLSSGAGRQSYEAEILVGGNEDLEGFEAIIEVTDEELFDAEIERGLIGGGRNRFVAGDEVDILADARAGEHLKFVEWKFTSSGDVEFTPTFTEGDANSAGATFLMPAFNIKITATYDDIIYEHTYIANNVDGGTGSKFINSGGISNSSFVILSIAEVEARDDIGNWAAPESHYFGGWSLSSSGFVAPTFDVGDVVLEDETLYAHWIYSDIPIGQRQMVQIWDFGEVQARDTSINRFENKIATGAWTKLLAEGKLVGTGSVGYEPGWNWESALTPPTGVNLDVEFDELTLNIMRGNIRIKFANGGWVGQGKAWTFEGDVSYPSATNFINFSNENYNNIGFTLEATEDDIVTVYLSNFASAALRAGELPTFTMTNSNGDVIQTETTTKIGPGTNGTEPGDKFEFIIPEDGVYTFEFTSGDGIYAGNGFRPNLHRVTRTNPEWLEDDVEREDVTSVVLTSNTFVAVGRNLALDGYVEPVGKAYNEEITWEIKEAGATGATLSSGNILSATDEGVVVITARVIDGVMSSSGADVFEDFTEDFNITITPIYTVTYDVNGGTGTIASQEVEPDENGVGTVALRPIGAVTNTTGDRGPFEFMGWMGNPDGGQVFAPASTFEVSGNITLYAAWEREPATGAYVREPSEFTTWAELPAGWENPATTTYYQLNGNIGVRLEGGRNHSVAAIGDTGYYRFNTDGTANFQNPDGISRAIYFRDVEPGDRISFIAVGGNADDNAQVLLTETQYAKLRADGLLSTDESAGPGGLSIAAAEAMMDEDEYSVKYYEGVSSSNVELRGYEVPETAETETYILIGLRGTARGSVQLAYAKHEPWESLITPDSADEDEPEEFTEVTLTYDVGTAAGVILPVTKKLVTSTEFPTLFDFAVRTFDLIDGEDLTHEGIFRGWATVEGGPVAYEPGDRLASKTDFTLYAVFSPAQEYEWTLIADEGAAEPGIADEGTALEGSSVGPISVPAASSGYVFKEWKVYDDNLDDVTLIVLGENPGNKANPLTFTMPSFDIFLVATYEEGSAPTRVKGLISAGSIISGIIGQQDLAFMRLFVAERGVEVPATASKANSFITSTDNGSNNPGQQDLAMIRLYVAERCAELNAVAKAVMPICSHAGCDPTIWE
ncbi:MAG: InlB B-repeat-containing protein [Oscillospiraceae bacterium]|nr:InlB B-repeat-containing protein [Oscillospiraceae bacterium]